MSQIPATPPGFDSLTTEEKIRYLQDLWDQIAADPDSVPIPESHRKTLEERLKDYEADPEAGRPWEEVRDDILSKL